MNLRKEVFSVSVLFYHKFFCKIPSVFHEISYSIDKKGNTPKKEIITSLSKSFYFILMEILQKCGSQINLTSNSLAEPLKSSVLDILQKLQLPFDSPIILLRCYSDSAQISRFSKQQIHSFYCTLLNSTIEVSRRCNIYAGFIQTKHLNSFEKTLFLKYYFETIFHPLLITQNQSIFVEQANVYAHPILFTFTGGMK